VAFVVDVDEKGRFDFYAIPGDTWLAVRARKDAKLDYLPVPWLKKLRYVPGLNTSSDLTLNYLPGGKVTIPTDANKSSNDTIAVNEVSGRIVGTDGTPVPRARITVDPVGHDNLQYEYVTDDQGRFRIWINNEAFQFIRYKITFRGPDNFDVYEPLSIQWEPKDRDDDHGFPRGALPDVVLRKQLVK
jgi:hypothetical protein